MKGNQRYKRWRTGCNEDKNIGLERRVSKRRVQLVQAAQQNISPLFPCLSFCVYNGVFLIRDAFVILFGESH